MAPAIMERNEKGIDDEDDSVAVIENAMKQIAFASTRDRGFVIPKSRPITIQQQQPQIELRIDDRRGGPDFKAQTDSRSTLAVQPVVAKPSGPNDDDADFYGRVAPSHRNQVTRDAASQVVLVAAIPEQQQRSKERKEHTRTASSSKRTKTTKQKKRSINQSPKRFWLALISAGIFLNMILAGVVTTSLLYFTGSFAKPAADTTAPTMSPTGSWDTEEIDTTVLTGTGDVSASPPQNMTSMGSAPVAFSPPEELLDSPPPLPNAPVSSPTFQDMVVGRNSSGVDDPPVIPDDPPIIPNDPPVIQESEPSRRSFAVTIVALVAILLEIGIVVGLRRIYRSWKTKMTPMDATTEEEYKDSSASVYF